jgi:Tol biopolymer transport system component
MRPGLAATALLAALATGCGNHGHNPGTIVFQSDRSGHDALYTVRPDGSGLTRLLALSAEGADVFWTRNGKRALVIANRAYVFEPASRSRRNIRLRGVAQVSAMPWSPDGKRLVLGTKQGDVVLDVETGKRRPLRDERANDLLAWSPDGKRLLFPSGRNLYTVPADGGPEKRLMRLGRINPRIPAFADQITGVQWSSDGKWISFVDEGLYAVRSDGTGLRLIAHGDEQATWSPTSERLAFPNQAGIVVVELETGRRQLIKDRLVDRDDAKPAWSPDGERILYMRDDLGYGAALGYHTQLSTMKADGTDTTPVTRAFPYGGTVHDDGTYYGSTVGAPVWVESTLRGTPDPRLRLVSLPGTRTLATGLPIVALGVAGNRGAVAQGFGGIFGPLGPIVVWSPARRSTLQVPVTGCGTTGDVLLAAGGVAYRCDNPSVSYGGDYSLRVARPGRRGWTEIVHTSASEFSGSPVDGVAGEANTIAFDVGSIGNTAQCQGCIQLSRIWIATGARKTIVRTFPGEATVTSVDRGRIAVLREGKAVSVLLPGGAIRTFAFGRAQILGAALDGPRLVVLQGRRLTVLDLSTGGRTVWPVGRGFGPEPYLQDAEGDLAAYVVGVAIHILRLSDGQDFVIDTPNATEPVFARFVPSSGLFYSFNESYSKRPGRLVFVKRSEVDRALSSTAAAP